MRRLPTLLIALSMALAACGTTNQAQQAPRHQTHSTASVSPTAAPTATPAHLATLRIPALGVIAAIESVTVDNKGNMAIPQKPMDVGWYSPGVVPGDPGDAVIDGHLNWYRIPRGPFYSLSKLQVGDDIEVDTQSGTRLRFTVSVKPYSVPYTSHPATLFERGGKARLSLVTCSGDWDQARQTYLNREIVDSTYQGVIPQGGI
jgi:sortase (surface protein transpeptidase)